MTPYEEITDRKNEEITDSDFFCQQNYSINNNIIARINIIESIIEDNKTRENKKEILYNQDYLESVKYYYIEYEDDIINKIEHILDYDLVKNTYLFNKIKDSLDILVYNINSIQHEQEQEKEQQRNTNTNIENPYNELLDKIINYEYENYDFTDIISDETIFINKTIKISDTIRCVPNLFTQLDTYDLILNKSGFLFVYIHKQLLLIPGYLFIHFNECILLSLYLSYLNNTDMLIDDTEMTQ